MRRVVKNPVAGALFLVAAFSILTVLVARPAKYSSADSTWVTIINSDLGYSLERPTSSSATYYLPEEILNIGLLPGPAVVSVRSFDNPDKLSSSAWTDMYLLNPKLRGFSPMAPPLPTSERQQITLAGVPAERFIVHGPVESIRRTVVANDNSVFVLDHQIFEGAMADVLDQIVSSLQFGDYQTSEGFNQSATESAENISELPVPHYSQRDPRWVCDQIGTCWCYLGNCSGYTGIGDAGCYITAESMIFDYYTGGFMDPQELDTCLTNNGGYGLWQGCGWGLCATTYDPISACSPSVVTYEGMAGSRDVLDQDLQNGYPVIAWVDGGVHYLVVTGKESGRYLVNDPLYSRTSIYSGEIIYFIRLHGPLPSAPVLDSGLQSGFPAPAYRTPGTQFSDAFQHVLIANLDEDPQMEIAATSLGNGPLYTWDSDGSLAEHWPQGISSGQAFPSAGKLTEHPQMLSMLSGFGSGDIHGYQSDGSTLPGWPTLTSPGGAPASLADVDHDGLEEVFIPTGDGQIAAFHPDGTSLAGWPVQAPAGQTFSTPAIADLDSDGDLEIISIYGSNGGGLTLYGFSHDGQILVGFPIGVPGSNHTVPVIGDVDGDLQNEIVVAGSGASVQIYSHLGLLERTLVPEGSFSRGTAPALADLDKDGAPEIIVQADYSLNVWKGDGTILTGWPENWGSEYLSGSSSPVVGDVDGDGNSDIAITLQAADLSGSGELRVYDRDAGQVPGGQKTIEIGPGAIPAIADIDLDDRNEIIVLSTAAGPDPGFDDKLYVFDLGGAPHGEVEWGQFGGGPQRRGVYPVPSAPPPANVPPVELGASYLPLVRANASPEPAVIHGKVTVNGETVAGVPVTLRYFDGQDWMDWISLATATDGRYSFVSPPGLTPDEQYVVRFSNDANDPNLVAQWDSRAITNYHLGGRAGISQVDLVDLVLLSPAPSATLSFPATFSWGRDAASSEFLYRFVLYDPVDGSPFFQSPLLENLSNFTLSSLPAGFENNQSYSWSAWIYGSDGAQLIPRASRTISFSPTKN